MRSFTASRDLAGGNSCAIHRTTFFFTNYVCSSSEDKRIQYLKVVEAIPLQTPMVPLLVEALGPTRHQFFQIPQVCQRRLLASLADESDVREEFRGRMMGHIAQRLKQEHDLPNQPLDVVMTCPVAHALLLAFKQWTWYALAAPYATGSLHSYTDARLIAPIVAFELPKRAHRNQQAQPVPESVVQHGPITLQDVAAGLRNALKDNDLSDQDKSHYAALVSWLEKSYQESLGNRSLHTHVIHRTWQWRIMYLLKHVLLSLELKSAANMYRTLRTALTRVLPAVWCDTFISMLDSVPRPSRATLYAHRLTLHIVFF